jgi:hypothetical protein
MKQTKYLKRMSYKALTNTHNVSESLQSFASTPSTKHSANLAK